MNGSKRFFQTWRWLVKLSIGSTAAKYVACSRGRATIRMKQASGLELQSGSGSPPAVVIATSDFGSSNRLRSSEIHGLEVES
jgi:hypothetical protein